LRTGGRFIVSTAASAGGAVLKGLSTATACIKPKNKERIYNMTPEEIAKKNQKLEKKRAKAAKKAARKFDTTRESSFELHMDFNLES